MQALARFAIRRRWFVVAGWILFIVAAQSLLAGIGGSDYQDNFKLPHTETQAVARLLSDAGLESQNGASATRATAARTSSYLRSRARTIHAATTLPSGRAAIA